MKFKMTWMTLAFVFLVLTGFAPADEPAQVSIEKFTDPVFQSGLSIPLHFWASDGTLLLYDRRIPADKRTIERYDPQTMKRSAACDAAAALNSLKPLLKPDGEKPADALPWPDAIALDGSRALYSFQGDLFLLNLKQSKFTRLTQTAEEEKNVSFSPDSLKIAFVRANNLFTIDVKTGKEQALTTDGSPTVLNGTLSWVYWEEVFGRQDTAYWWSPDSAAVAFMQSDESKVAESVFPLYEPATPKVIHQRYAKAGGANPTVRVGIVELARRGVTWLKTSTPPPEYILRVNWLPDSRKVVLQTMNRIQNRVDLVLADRRSGASRALLTETSPTYLNIYDDLHFIEGGAKFIWASERDGRNQLYLYEHTGKLVRQLTSGDLVVRASSGVAWVRGGICGLDEKNHWVYFTAAEGSPIAPNLYRLNWDGGDIVRITQRNGTHRVSMDPSCRFVLDEYSTVRQPTGLYLLRADGTEAATLTPPAIDTIAEYSLQYPEFFTIPADDGFLLPAQITKPRDFDPAKKYPVIIYLYGGPGAPMVWNAWDRDIFLNNVLLNNGFIHVVVDNRSASGLSKTLEDTVYHKLMAGGEVEDILAAVRWLKAQPFVDPDRIGVWGWSGGGTFTLQLMTHSTAFKAGIAVAAVTDFRYYDTKWTEGVLGLPGENPEGYRQGSPANFARNLSGRLLLVHGTYDDNVHPQNALRFIHELIKAGIQFDMIFYPLEKHGIASRPSRVHLYKTMLAFWQRWL